MRRPSAVVIPALAALLAIGPADAAVPILGDAPAWTGPVENTQAIALGDVDADGKLDLVRGNSRQVSTLYLNTGRTLAAAPFWQGQEQGTVTIALGDVDGDGDLDLVRGNYDRGATLHLNLGGTFTTDTTWMGPPESNVALADVDLDGDLDLVCGSLGQVTTTYLNLGGLFSRTPIRSGARENTMCLALGDVDGDGSIDLVRGNAGRSTLHLNHGGVFDSIPAWRGPVATTTSVALGDVDGDGRLDLICGTDGQGARLFRNLGATFSDTALWRSPSASATSVALGDADGDGRLDLVCGDAGQGITLHLNAGVTFETAPAWTGPAENTASVALGDVDGDGDLDLFRGNHGQPATLYLNSSGAFAPEPAWSGPAAHTHAVGLGDVDGDGDLDLVRGNAGQPAMLHLNDAGILTSAPWNGPVENTHGLALGDIDSDGRLDLVRGNQDDFATLYVNTGSGFGSSPSQQIPPDQQRTASVALGDVDGDGRLDLIRGNQERPALLHLNRGGRFDSSFVAVGQAENTFSVALGDVDGDGRLDLVRGNLTGATTLYLDRAGSFGPSPAWSGPVEATYAVALGDIDGDGRLDLVRGNTGPDQASLYLNVGGGFAAAPAWSGLVEATQSVALGDVDGDGRLDLVRGNFGEGTTLYLNQGANFGFTPAWTAAPESTRSVALGDVDGDGWLDLIRGNDEASGSQATTLHLHRAPWIPGTTDSLPRRHLPNNAAHLRWVRVAPSDSNTYRISLEAFDAESDPLWLVGEYQFHGAPSWYPMEFASGTLRTGPFATSRGGVDHAITWNIASIPFDRREVAIRLRAISLPRLTGATQFIPSYLMNVGRIVPRRPELRTSLGSLAFPTITVGDTAIDSIRIWNPGNQDLVVHAIESPDAEVIVEAPADVVVPAGDTLSIRIVLAPRRPFSPGPLRIHSNDPLHPLRELPLVTDVRALEIETRLLAVAPEVPLGEAATVIVTPRPQVRVESGMLFFRPRTQGAPFESDTLIPQGSNFAALIPGDRVTEAGLEYYVQVQNGPATATDPPTAPDSTFRQAVAVPTLVSAAARPDSAGVFPSGRSTTIVVSLLRGSRFLSGTLFHRFGGSVAYDSVTIDSTEITPGVVSAAIPGEFVDARGLEYWVRVRTLTRTLTDPALEPHEHPHVLRIEAVNLAETVSHQGGRYRMLSIPLELGPPAPPSLEAILFDQLGEYDPVRWRSFRYRPGLPGYVELSAAAAESGELRPEPGRAFWLVARESHRIDTAPIAGRSTPSGAPYRITIEPGWNQVGNPFAFPVSWSAVVGEGPAGPVTIEPPVAWDETAGRYADGDVATLEPFQGYWILNPNPEPVDLLVPPVSSLSPAPGTPGESAVGSVSGGGVEGADEDSSDWRIQITAEVGARVDRRNYAGVSTLASESTDPFDRSEPPLAPGESVALYFLSEHSPDHRRSADIRPAMLSREDGRERGCRWTLDVITTRQSSDPLEARLVFDGLDRVPSDLELRLFDRVSRREIDLREQRQYAYRPAQREWVSDASRARFELRAGTREYLEGLSPREPRFQTRLLPVYPNPIVRMGIVRFELASTGRVTMGVFDVSGRRVRRLVEASLEAGYHEIAWSGDDEKGRALSPGVYLLRLEASGVTDTRKLVKTP